MIDLSLLYLPYAISSGRLSMNSVFIGPTLISCIRFVQFLIRFPVVSPKLFWLLFCYSPCGLFRLKRSIFLFWSFLVSSLYFLHPRFHYLIYKCFKQKEMVTVCVPVPLLLWFQLNVYWIISLLSFKCLIVLMVDASNYLGFFLSNLILVKCVPTHRLIYTVKSCVDNNCLTVFMNAVTEK